MTEHARALVDSFVASLFHFTALSRITRFTRQICKMSDHDEQEEVELPGVRVKMYMRCGGSREYEQYMDEVTTLVNPQSTSIGFTFPDGTSTLDRVVVDGVQFHAFDLMMIDTGVKTGSLVEVYSTSALDDHDDE